MFGFPWRPFPMPVTTDPPTDARDLQIVWRYFADVGGSCDGCRTSFKPNDPLVAVGKPDSEARSVFHAGCFDPNKEEAA